MSGAGSIQRVWAWLGAAAGLAAVWLALAQQPPAQAQAPALEQRLAAVLRQSSILRDIEYARPLGQSLKLDLYRPGSFQGSLPIVVFIHGGGWKSGDKANAMPAVLAGYGYAVASINYRLSPQAPFPAQIQDCKAAVRWLRANAGTYRLDPSRVGVWGSSAGGHLAALVALAPDKPEWEVGEHLNQSSRVQAACDFFGPTDFTDLQGGPRAEERLSTVRELVGGKIKDKLELVRSASPLFYVTPSAPPFFIAHGVDDDLVPISQSRKLHAALRRAQVPAELLEVSKARHGFAQGCAPGPAQIYIRVLNHFNRYLKAGQ